MSGEGASKEPTWWRRYRVVLFLVAGLLLVDLAVRATQPVWRAYEPDEYPERVAGCRWHRPELLVVGGSPVSEGIDPTKLSGLCWDGQRLHRVYNMGLAGGTTTEVCLAVRHGVREHPRLLVYGITASDLNDSRKETQGPYSLMSASDLVEFAITWPESATWAVGHFLEGKLYRSWGLYHHRNGIRLAAADLAERTWPGLCPEAASEARQAMLFGAALQRPDGYAPRPNLQAGQLASLKKAKRIGPRFLHLKDYRLGAHREYLDRLLDWAGERDVPVVLVDMPVSADLERMHPEAFGPYRRLLRQVERERGVRIIRQTRERSGLREEDFSDLIHLNRQGAQKFSAWLRQALEE